MSAPLGFALSSNTGLLPRRLVALAAEAERHGYGTIALTESYNDVMPLAAAVATATESAAVMTTIANTGFRHPALMAMGALGVDELSGGRFVLGLGVGTQWFDRQAVQAELARPLAALSEYIRLVHQLCAAGQAGTELSGELYRLDRFRLDFQPLRPRLPIYLAAMGPGMLRLVGRLADGVLLGLSPIEEIPRMVAEIHDAAVAAGRSPDDVTIAMQIRTCLHDDLSVARDGARAALPMYFAFPGYARHLRTLGYGAAVEAVAAALQRGDARAAAAAIPDELVDRVSIHGPRQRCLAELERWRAAGIAAPIIAARRTDQDWASTLATAITAFAPRPGPAA